jgi:DNA-binding NtrC family response regulator
LRNLVYRIVCLAPETADIEHLPVDIRPGNSASMRSGMVASAVSLSDAKRTASDEAERAFLERGLHEVGGTVAELARRFEMNRSHVQMLLKKHGLHSKDFRNHAGSAAQKEKSG